MKKLAFLIFVLICVFTAGCGENTVNLSGMVEIKYLDEMILSKTMSVSKIGPKAADIIVRSCEENNISYSLKNGRFDNINGLETNGDMEWNLYCNGEKITTKAEEFEIKDNYHIELKYEKINS